MRKSNEGCCRNQSIKQNLHNEGNIFFSSMNICIAIYIVYVEASIIYSFCLFFLFPLVSLKGYDKPIAVRFAEPKKVRNGEARFCSVLLICELEFLILFLFFHN